MNTKRIFFWAVFLIVLALILWGLVVAMNKPANTSDLNLGSPAPISATDHVRGPADAPVTMIEYSDFQCPACEAYYPMVTKLLSDSASSSTSTPIRFVYRHFPLPQHPNAIPAAVAAEAAGAQGKFWEMYDLLFTNHTDWTELSDPTSVFMGYAAQLHLDAVEFKTDLASSTLKSVIQTDLAEGQSLGIDATPTFFLNGKAVSNPSSYDQFKSLVQAAAAGGTR
jgi:protein-disulfide isomerase